MNNGEKGGRARPRGSLRDRLVAEAQAIVEHDGLGALTLRAVARAAGVSHMAPYRHFASKEALLAAVVARGFEALSNAMDTGGKQSPPEHRGLGLGVGYVDFAVAHPALYRLMFGATGIDKSAYPELEANQDAAYRRCREAVIGRDTGEPSAGELVERQALILWALVHGLASLMIDKAITYPAGDAEARRTFILAALATPPPG